MGSDRNAERSLVINEGKTRRRLLRRWAQLNGRHFPWRQKPDAWQCLVAEMLLRRTRAEQVAARLPSIMESFPTPRALALADWDSVKRAFQSFGLVWRTKTLHQAAKELVDRHEGVVPLDSSELMQLSGVGPYVAEATVAALTRRRVVLVDTNTVRVACRVAGIMQNGDVRRRTDVQIAITELLGGPAEGKDWWGVLDLAQKICLPRAPRCEECPISELCVTGSEQLGQVTRLHHQESP